MVLGIDGANLELINRWKDSLPNFASLIEDNGITELESTTPPVTSPAWRCYATGKDPNSIGVYWWRQLVRDERTFVGADEIPLDSKCYWEYLSERGDDVAIIGVPLNAPPRPVNGQLIAGGPFANPDDYTYPESLSEIIEEKFDYQLHPETYPSVENATKDEIVADFDSMINQRFDVAEWLLETESPSLLNLTLFYINVMQHKAWDATEVRGLWETIDERLGNLLEDNMDIIIHSDHGLHEVKRVFYINGWLMEKGYLVLAEEDNQGASSIAVDEIKNALGLLGVKSLVKRALPGRLIDAVTSGRRLIDPKEYESRIDFERSKAVALPQGPVYDLSADDSFVNVLKSELESVVDPKTGNEVLSGVEFADDVYDGDLRPDSPDLLVRWNDGFEVKDRHSDAEEKVFGSQHGVIADNAQKGILLGAGPNLSNEHPDKLDAYLYDLAPTLLHLHGHPIPDDLSGDVLKSFYTTASEAAERSVEVMNVEEVNTQTEHKTAAQDVDDRLRDLGYLE
ncbi:alkaline phosphatase family protein [Halobium salinum]|uniref:alkaline phosphatase family protein n=1 Tax=Halobium salinum TaxID=1364940 RepID=UPI002270D647|nr:alkaline phosphatase family protein [Halobium salinum]